MILCKNTFISYPKCPLSLVIPTVHTFGIIEITIRAVSPEKKVGVRRPLLVKNPGSQNENFESALGRKIDMARSAKIFGGYFGDLVLDLVCILSFSTFL